MPHRNRHPSAWVLFLGALYLVHIAGLAYTIYRALPLLSVLVLAVQVGILETLVTRAHRSRI